MKTKMIALLSFTFSLTAHANTLTIDPRTIKDVSVTETAEIRETVGCQLYQWNGSMWMGIHDDKPISCSNLREALIGRRENGKPKRNKAHYGFEDVTTYGRDESVVIRRSGETELVLGPVHDKRKEETENDVPYRNFHVAAKATIDRIVAGAFNVYWTKQADICYRELLVIGEPAEAGEMPSVSGKSVPLDYSACTNPAAGITAVERTGS